MQGTSNATGVRTQYAHCQWTVIKEAVTPRAALRETDELESHGACGHEIVNICSPLKPHARGKNNEPLHVVTTRNTDVSDNTGHENP